jgi:peroxiredoxin Q/BCP
MGILSFLRILPQQEPLAIGDEVPEVISIDEEGQRIDLKKLSQESDVLVYFYPKADTPGCTAQACNLRDAFSRLTDQKLSIFGVSQDSEDAQQKFRQKHQLPFPLIADTERVLMKAFRVNQIPFLGIPMRQSFLIRGGIIIWRDLKAIPNEQAETVLQFLKVNEI